MEKTESQKEEPIKFSDAWNALKSSPRGLYIIFFLKFLESYSYFCIIYTLIIFLSEELKYSDEQAGWCYGIFGMCTSLYGFIFGGFLIDNLGVKISLCVGCSILLAGRLLLVICTHHLYVLLILYTFLPIGTCLGIPVMQIAIRRYTNEKSRSLAYSLFYAMMNVSAIFSGSAIDFFRRHVPDTTITILSFNIEITSYRALFLSGACTTTISLFTSLFFISNNLEDEQVEHSDEEAEALIDPNGSSNGLVRSEPTTPKKMVGPLTIIKEVSAQKSFWKFVFVILLLMGVRVVYRHLDATFPKYMMREFGKDVMYGSIIAINPFLIVILIPIFAPLSYQFSAYTQITFGAFITSLSPFFLVIGSNLYNSVMFVVILSIGEALWSPRLYEYTIFITEKGREGIYMALASSPMFIATLLTGATSGFFLENFCPEKGPRESWKMWLLIGLLTLTSPILLFLLKNKIEVTKEELQQEKIEKKKRKDEEKLSKKVKSTYSNLVISNNIDIDYKSYQIAKQADIYISNK
jgi:MFS family permease